MSEQISQLPINETCYVTRNQLWVIVDQDHFFHAHITQENDRIVDSWVEDSEAAFAFEDISDAIKIANKYKAIKNLNCRYFVIPYI